VRARGGGEETGRSPTDRGKKGSKHHAAVDPHSIPLSATATAANRPDVTEVLEVVDAIPDVGGKRGRPRRRPEALYADRAYDSRRHRRALRDRGINPRVARRGHGERTSISHNRRVDGGGSCHPSQRFCVCI
jgi:IS5 family transposase